MFGVHNFNIDIDILSNKYDLCVLKFSKKKKNFYDKQNL